jgi:transcriptional antiterminator RfaH
MPILPPEPSAFPEDLLDAEVATISPGQAWWVLHTRPRQEKWLARQLCQKGVSFYLPLYSRRSRIRGRLITAQVPLFPGYLFLLGNREGYLAALKTNRVVRPLRVAAQEELWRDLRQVRRLLASGIPVTPEGRLVPGTLVEITSGPLAGLQGKIVAAASGKRFVVEVDFIQRGASVLVEDFTLRPLLLSPGQAAFLP